MKNVPSCNQNKSRNWLVSMILLLLTSEAALSNTCGIAVSQLQNYVYQVNSAANTAYYNYIPMQCGYNPMCQQTLLNQLNNWYMQQTYQVNAWYSQILQQCNQQPPQIGKIPNTGQSDSRPGKIDEDTVKDIKVDDEDKTVRIRIPSTPEGFK
jgi:hypothetical protein